MAVLMEKYIDKIICGDCLDVMQGMPDECVDLVFADPPFNVGKAYQDSRDNYREWCAEWIAECFRVLKPAGSFYLMTIEKHLQDKYAEMGKHGAFISQVIWKHASPLAGERRFAFNYQPIIIYGKTDEYLFNPKAQMLLNTILVTRKVAKAKPELTTGYMGRVGNIWDIGYIGGGCMAPREAILADDSKKKAHPCQMPIALAERAILFSTNELGVVLDPFMGSGTTAIAAIRAGRHWIGIELEERFCEIARQRVRIEQAQLKLF